MPIDVKIRPDVPPKETAASLVSGILGDLQQLVEQQFQLTRCQIEEEIRERSAAAAVFGMGLAVFFVDAFLLCLSGAHLLHWLSAPVATDPARLPLWACEALVGGVLTVVGGVLVWAGRRRFQAVNAFQNPATEIF